MKLKFLGLISAVILSVTWTTNATILTFENTIHFNDGLQPNNYLPSESNGPLSYGDRVNSLSIADPDPVFAGGLVYTYGLGNGFTPNVLLDFTSQAGAGSGQKMDYNFGPSHSNNEVDYLAYNDNFKFWITFTPDAGYGVKVNSFDIEIDDYLSTTPDVSWALRQDSTSGTIVASGTELAVSAVGNHAVNLGAASYYGPLVLELSYTGTSNNGLVSIDNLNFDQVAPIPEPSTLLLILTGGWLAWHRWHNRAWRK